MGLELNINAFKRGGVGHSFFIALEGRWRILNNYKAEITLAIIVLVLFGGMVAFATGVVDPLMAKIGAGWTKMVDNVFSGIGV